MDKLGIEASMHPRAEFLLASACRVCRGCPAKDRCRATLEGGPATLRAFAPFCPNAGILQELRHEQPWMRVIQAVPAAGGRARPQER